MFLYSRYLFWQWVCPLWGVHLGIRGIFASCISTFGNLIHMPLHVHGNIIPKAGPQANCLSIKNRVLFIKLNNSIVSDLLASHISCEPVKAKPSLVYWDSDIFKSHDKLSFKKTLVWVPWENILKGCRWIDMISLIVSFYLWGIIYEHWKAN